MDDPTYLLNGVVLKGLLFQGGRMRGTRVPRLDRLPRLNWLGVARLYCPDTRTPGHPGLEAAADPRRVIGTIQACTRLQKKELLFRGRLPWKLTSKLDSTESVESNLPTVFMGTAELLLWLLHLLSALKSLVKWFAYYEMSARDFRHQRWKQIKKKQRFIQYDVIHYKTRGIHFLNWIENWSLER